MGICQECGKSACRECIDDIFGSMICKGCIERRQTLWNQQQQEEEVERQAEAVFIQKKARKRVRCSYLVGFLGLSFFAVIAMMESSQDVRPPMPGIFMVPFGGYVCWSIYWGFIWIWPKWRGWVNRFRQALSGWILFARPFTWLILIMFYLTFYLSIPLSLAIYYGVFGGGIYQFRKHRRLAATNEVLPTVKTTH
ncbi:MAG TPA: hypothetical protein VGU23_01775 [Acidobacteriaceae bacterium]|nr:hypothetical protein [Acidobacteriaceae bacterium]